MTTENKTPKEVSSSVFVAPSLPYLKSNKPYPIIPYTTSSTSTTEKPGKNGLKCPPLMRGGLQWNWTEAGKKAKTHYWITEIGMRVFTQKGLRNGWIGVLTLC